MGTPLELGESTDTLFRAVAAVADALYVVDAAGRIAFLNPAALEILGYTDEHELLGKPSHATIHYLRPDGSPFPEEECPLLRPRLSGQTVWIERDWFVRRDGSSVPVAYSSAPVDLDGGRGAVVAFRDLSERLRLGEVEASRARIVRAASAARRTIQRDLHDGAQQQFVAVALKLEIARALDRRPASAGSTPTCRRSGRSRRGTRGAAPARPRHSPGRALRPRPRAGSSRTRAPHRRPSRSHGRRARAADAGNRIGRLLHRCRGDGERRQARNRESHRHRGDNRARRASHHGGGRTASAERRLETALVCRACAIEPRRSEAG